MVEAHPLRTVFLGSGSSGNCTAVTDGETTLLVDCGFSAREVSRRLSACGIAPASVSAMLVTHEHSDHIRGIDVFVRRHAPGCVVYASVGTRRHTRLDGSIEMHTIGCGDAFSIGAMEVVAFQMSHDAAEPLGFRVGSGNEALGIVTDTGVLTPQAAEALAGVTVLGIESNHDTAMLEHGPYPAFLKRRIRSRSGHLSNADAATALTTLASDRLTKVFALHRSRTNNTAELAHATLVTQARRLGLAVEIEVASQETPCDSRPPQEALFG
jgi:phosphoribosyl 1,2-cyclic phosphodiesterase